MNTSGTRIGSYPIGASCPWRVTEAAPAVSPAQIPKVLESVKFTDSPVTFGGVTVNAPGFTADQFGRAICRAFADDLVIHEAAGYHLVTHRGVNGGYHVTRVRCTCKAGEHNQPCKHRAMLIFHLDIRKLKNNFRQWADARKAVAA